MAENLLGFKRNKTDAWYPEIAAEFHGKAFLKTLQRDNIDLYEKAYDFFMFEKFDLATARHQKNLVSLLALIEREEQKEKNLMLDIFGKDNYSNLGVGERIKLINSLYSARGVFENNIQKIQNIKDGKGGGRIDVTTKFPFYLEKELEKLTDATLLTEEVLKQCVENALYMMFGEVDKKTGNSPYAELAHALDRLKNNSGSPWIVEELFALYFGVPYAEVQKALLEEEDSSDAALDLQKVKKKLWVDYLYGGKKGNVLEAVEALALDATQKALGGKVYRTGASGMKADNIVTYKIEVDVSKVFEDAKSDAGRAVRARSVDRLNALFDKIGSKGGYVVEISDKNYSLTSATFAENRGFAAQVGFKLNNFEALLNKMNVDKSDINSLMFVLANTGSELIGGEDADVVCDFVATYIGYFLFDDLHIDENFNGLKTQAIHLFNLDGIYIPLSVFLRAAYYAFTKLPEKAKDYVNVSYNSNLKYKKQTDGLQEEDWTELYQYRMTHSSLDIHFFGDFVSFIKANIQL